VLNENRVGGIGQRLDLRPPFLAQRLILVGERLVLPGPDNGDGHAFHLVLLRVFLEGGDHANAADQRRLVGVHLACRAPEPVRSTGHGIAVGGDRLHLMDSANQVARVVTASDLPATGVDVEKNLFHFRVIDGGNKSVPDFRIAGHAEEAEHGVVHVDQRTLDRDRGQPIRNAQEPWFIARFVFVVGRLPVWQARRWQLAGWSRTRPRFSLQSCCRVAPG
jgi:hypothetical protein